MLKAKKERRATYTVKIPVQFTFSAISDIDCEELHKLVLAELDRRLESGYFDVLEGDWALVKKTVHYTREELEEQKRIDNEIFKSLFNLRGLKK